MTLEVRPKAQGQRLRGASTGVERAGHRLAGWSVVDFLSAHPPHLSFRSSVNNISVPEEPEENPAVDPNLQNLFK